MNIDVSLRTLDSFDIKEVESAVREGFADMKIERLLRPKMRVLLKVCMPDNLHPDKALTTNPSIARGIINVLTDLGVSVVVADSPYGKYTDTHLEEVYITTGMLDVANSSKCELDRSLATGMLFTPNGIKARSIQILDIVNQVDAIINLGKIKMNDRIGFSGVCDNIFGLVPGEVKTQIIRRLDRVKDYNDYIIDMLDALEDKIILNIADAVVAVENGETQRMLSCLGMSSNPYALDAAFVNIIGMDPKNTIIKQAMDRAKIDIKTPYKMVGEKIDKFKVEDFAFSEVEEDKKLNDYTAIHPKGYPAGFRAGRLRSDPGCLYPGPGAAADQSPRISALPQRGPDCGCRRL